MQYRNRKTGSIIDIKSRLSGGDWEPVEPAPKPLPQKRQVVKKKDVKLCDA